MKLFVIFGMFLVLSSCSINSGITGKFISKKGSNMELKNDSSFIYEYRAFHLYQYSSGKWKMVNKNLISLTSEIKSTVVPITVTNIGDQGVVNMLSLDLKIDTNKILADYKCGVYVNDSLVLVKRCDSISSLEINVPIDNIYFKFIKEPALTTTTYIAPPIITDKYVTKTPKGNKLKIAINFNDSYFYYKSFDGDIVKRKGLNIKMYNAYYKRWKKLLRVSNKTNIFSHFNPKKL